MMLDSERYHYRAPLNPAFVKRVLEKRRRQEAEQKRIEARQAVEAEAAKAMKDAEDMRREMARAKEEAARLETEMARVQAKIREDQEKVEAFERTLAALDAKRRSKVEYSYALVEAKAMKLFGVHKHEMRSNRRNREIVFARQFIMYWTSRLTKMSTPQIGRIMGLDHTTVIHGREAYIKKRAHSGRTLRKAR